MVIAFAFVVVGLGLQLGAWPSVHKPWCMHSPPCFTFLTCASCNCKPSLSPQVAAVHARSLARTHCSSTQARDNQAQIDSSTDMLPLTIAAMCAARLSTATELAADVSALHPRHALVPACTAVVTPHKGDAKHAPAHDTPSLMLQHILPQG